MATWANDIGGGLKGGIAFSEAWVEKGAELKGGIASSGAWQRKELRGWIKSLVGMKKERKSDELEKSPWHKKSKLKK
jgi:hypothetical protein